MTINKAHCQNLVVNWLLLSFPISVWAMLAFPVSVNAQFSSVNSKNIEISGYYENMFFPQKMKDEVMMQDYNKLRLNLSSEVSTNITFNANINGQTYHGKTTLNQLDFIPEAVVDEYINSAGKSLEAVRPSFEYTKEDEIYLDNAYLSVYTKHINLRIGKQQLPWGTGYAWNPTDIFNAKNILDPTYEKVGVNVFKAEIPFSQEGMLTGIVSVGDNWKNTTKALKAGYHVAGFDISASYAEKQHTKLNYYTFEEMADKRQMFGADISGGIAGIGVWAEAAYNLMKNRGDYGQYLAGADYTFLSGLYFKLEYYRNGLGETSSKNYGFGHWMTMLGREAENLGKDYIYLGQMYPVGELVNWSNFFMINLNDGSGMVFPWFDFSLNDNTELILVGYFPFGKKETEFGEFGTGGFARIRIYF
jgi:hypothetical protein